MVIYESLLIFLWRFFDLMLKCSGLVKGIKGKFIWMFCKKKEIINISVILNEDGFKFEFCYLV